MDVLIIKKAADVKIDKNIGRIFKNHNIIEYKSENDSLAVWDYNKVTGYAMIYSAFNKISVKDITISFVITPKPIKLFDYLANDRGFEVDEASPGIYYVKGDTFAAQIIESKKLAAKENVFLKNLRGSLTHEDMQELFDAYRKYGSPEKVGAYLNRVLNANLSIMEEVLAMSDAVLDVVFKHLEKNGALEKVLEENGTLKRIRRIRREKPHSKCLKGVLRQMK